MKEIKYCEDFFKTTDKLKLYEQFWKPLNPAAIFIIVHGYAEHSKRYDWVARELVSQGFGVYTFDLRGHGKSEGKRGLIKSFDNYLQDFELFLQKVQIREPNKPIFLLGHSMGGAIATLFVIRHQPTLSGLILSSAVLGQIKKNISPILIQAAILLGRIVPNLPTISINSHQISRDPEEVKAYKNDPLIYQGTMSAQTLSEILKASSEIKSYSNEIKLPLLILQGTNDLVVAMEGSKELYVNAKSNEKCLKLYECCYHELLNEPEKSKILSDITTWVKKKIPTINSAN